MPVVSQWASMLRIQVSGMEIYVIEWVVPDFLKGNFKGQAVQQEFLIWNTTSIMFFLCL